MHILVLAVDQSSWMMSSALQVPNTYWNVPACESYFITAFTLLMLVLVVKVCSLLYMPKGYLPTMSANMQQLLVKLVS